MKKYLFAFLIFSSLIHAEEYSLLITGCGRSGTTFASRLFTRWGISIGHENLKQDGTASWLFAVDSDTAPWGPAPNEHTFTHIFHQVRYPLDVISSWYLNPLKKEKTWNYIYAHIPEISPDEPFLAKCAKYWYYWNLKAEEKAELTYRVETITDKIDAMSEILGLSLNVSTPKKLGTKINHWKPITQKVTWDDLAEVLDPKDLQNIQLLTLRYGYAL